MKKPNRCMNNTARLFLGKNKNQLSINMTRVRITIVLVFLLIVSIRGYAQQTCYQIGLVEGKEIFTDAQRLERSGKCVEAVPKYWEALRRFRLTRSCRDLPSNHELDSWEDRCIQGVAACGGKSNESTFLMASSQSLAFDENGGEQIGRAHV